MTPLFSQVQHFYIKRMLIVAQKYLTQSKDINKTETETNDGWYVTVL